MYYQEHKKSQKKCVTWYMENLIKLQGNVNDLNLHSAMKSDNLAFQTSFVVIAVLLFSLVGAYILLPHEGI